MNIIATTTLVTTRTRKIIPAGAVGRIVQRTDNGQLLIDFPGLVATIGRLPVDSGLIAPVVHQVELTCEECGELLTSTDVDAGEVVCIDCQAARIAEGD